MCNETLSARQCAIRYIGISLKSSGKVREYLLHKGFTEDIVRQTVESLCEEGYIDDLRTAGSVMKRRTGTKSEGRAQLFRRLVSAGIPFDKAQEALLDLPEDRERIQEFITNSLLPDYKKKSCFEGFDEKSWLLFALRKLTSKGFSAETSIEALRAFIHDVE